MKKLEEALFELEDIVNNKIKEYSIPFTKGKVVRLGNFIIRPSKRYGYLIIDTDTNKTVATMFNKVAAIAFVKAKIDNKPVLKIVHCDSIIEKNLNDLYFYNNVIENTDSLVKKDLIRCRLELSTEKIESARKILDDFILDNIR